MRILGKYKDLEYLIEEETVGKKVYGSLLKRLGDDRLYRFAVKMFKGGHCQTHIRNLFRILDKLGYTVMVVKTDDLNRMAQKIDDAKKR